MQSNALVSTQCFPLVQVLLHEATALMQANTLGPMTRRPISSVLSSREHAMISASPDGLSGKGKIPTSSAALQRDQEAAKGGGRQLCPVQLVWGCRLWHKHYSKVGPFAGRNLLASIQAMTVQPGHK
jgi:hypothetical protein